MTDMEHLEEHSGTTHLVDSDGVDVDGGRIANNADQLRRRLGNRQIQIIAIGGSIGTALFVSIGGGLNKGGPGSLILTFTLYSCVIAMVTNYTAEMTTLMPVSGGFVRMAGRWVDDAFAINLLAVRAYVEAECWLAGGKVILIFMLFSFTIITMVGGNPKKDAYGSHYWNKPGAFAQHQSTGSSGRFEGFLAALFCASFTVVGAGYISMVAAEAIRPNIYQ